MPPELGVPSSAQRENQALRQHVLDLRRAARAAGVQLNASTTFLPIAVRSTAAGLTKPLRLGVDRVASGETPGGRGMPARRALTCLKL